MLRVAERIEDTDDAQSFALATLPVAPTNSVMHPAPLASRYGASKSPNWIVIGLILVAHAVLIAAIMHVRHQVQRREEARLSVVNLTPPPLPPAEEAPPPPPTKPQIVAPPPIVQMPIPRPVKVMTTPNPAPAIVSPASVIAPPSPAPAVVAAPPSVMQGGDLSAQMVSGKPPRYPVESRRKREQGTVVLALTLGLDGGVESLSIARSSGFSRLDDAARDAVRRWRWKPTIQQGQPVKVKGVVEIPFVIQVSAT